MKRKLRLLSAALAIALAPLAVHAQTAGEVDTQVSSLSATGANAGQSQVANRIAASFASLAGSQDNALALVWGLREGTPVTLTAPTDPATTSTGTTTGSTGTTITPPTGKMGWGEVFISLALAKAELANMGITQPTAEQLQAALTGGDITGADGTTTTVKGILEMRADGMGWGQIAQAEGMKLGPVVSSIKSARVKVASLPPSSSSTTTSTGGSKSLTTAAGSTSTTLKGHKGIVTASGASSSHGSGHGHRGIVSAGGTSAIVGGKHGMGGITTASGLAPASGSQGLVNAGGAMTGGHAPHGNAFGQGVVTAAGGNAALVATNAAGGSGGLVTAGGGSANAGGITSAHGGGNGNGQAHGHHKGGG